MSSDGISGLEIEAAMPLTNQSPNPLVKGETNERVENADRAKTAEMTADGPTSISGESRSAMGSSPAISVHGGQYRGHIIL